ncbi:MAG: hypothetical protein DI539_13335 [Flavobacterium psychrophilum]|nr:MAG: hypothetical protein DI539_13335 [Flavobacterium psychrophilum]
MKYLIIAFILIASPGFAQKKKPVAKPATAKPATKQATEWDELDKTFVAFIKALENKDKTTFDNIALVQVDCAECPGSGEQGDITHYVPSDVFYITVAEDFKLSPVYKALANRGYAFNSMVLKGFKPKFIRDGSDSKDLKVYEVWVPTYKPNELSKGHPGSSHAFQFVKVNGEFRFFGLTSQTL